MKNYIIAFVALFLSACAAIPSYGPTGLAKGVDRDALNLNEAHTRSISGVITKNILRARDRWVTGYTTLSGIRFTPQIDLNLRSTLDPLGLGNPPLPFGESSARVERNESSIAQYNVNPFATDDGGPSLYKTDASEELFKRYVNAGWPIEVVFPLFVRSVTFSDDSRQCVLTGDHEFADALKGLFPDKSESATDSTTTTEKNPCEKLVDMVFKPKKPTWKMSDTDTYDCKMSTDCTARVPVTWACKDLEPALVSPLFSAPEEGLSERIKALESAAKVASTKQVKIGLSITGQYQMCTRPTVKTQLVRITEPSKKVSKPFKSLEYRSFNDMIHFLGESIRADLGGIPVHQCGTGKPTPLFKLTEDRGGEQKFGVVVEHTGKTFRGLGQPKTPDTCAADRTGTTLSILSEIFVFNQSKEFLEAPESILE